MEQIGYVAEIKNGMIKIRVERESACGGNCAACHGCPQGAVLIERPDDPERPYYVGECVKLITPGKSFFGGLFRSYGLLILGLLGGAILGYSLNNQESGAVLGGFGGLLLCGILVRVLNRKRQLSMEIQRETGGNKNAGA